MVAAGRFVPRQESPAQACLDSQQGKKTGGGARDIQAFRVVQAGQVVGCSLVGFYGLKATGLSSPGVEIVSGRRDMTARGLRLVRVRLPKHDNPRRIAKRKGAKQDPV